MKHNIFLACAFAVSTLAGCAAQQTTETTVDYVAQAQNACATANGQIAALQAVESGLPDADQKALDSIANIVSPICKNVASIDTTNGKTVYQSLLNEIPTIAILLLKYAPLISAKVTPTVKITVQA